MSGKIFIEQFRRLLKESREKNEFEFVNVLLGYKGMGGMMSLTHFYESQSLFQDMSALITEDHNDKNNVRIGLFLYSHFFEMDELYRVLGNLLIVVKNLEKETIKKIVLNIIDEELLETSFSKIGTIKEIYSENENFEGIMASI